MDILKAARTLRPGSSWNLRGGKLEQAEDGSPRVSSPSLEEINACIANDPIAYREKRLPEYPAIGDQLDALWKVIAHGGFDELPGDAKIMLDKIIDVKLKFPKTF